MDSDQEELITLESDPPKRKGVSKTAWIVIFLIHLIIVGVIFGIVVATKKDDTSSDYTVDIKWFYDVCLSQRIDATGLKHGVLYKYMDLTEYQQGLYRKDFNINYTYNGIEPETIQAYNTLIEQSRFVNIFAETYERTNDTQFLQAMNYGLQVLLNDFHDDEYGGYYWQIQRFTNGSYIVLDYTKETQSMGFLIKALATVYRVTLNETILDIAGDVYMLLINTFTDQTGVGLVPRLLRNMSSDPTVSGRNIMQHFVHSLGKLYNAYQLNGNNEMAQQVSNKINDIWDFFMTLRINATFNSTNSNSKYRNGIEYLLLPTGFTSDWQVNPSSDQYKGMSIGVSFELALWFAQMIEYGIIPDNNTNWWNIDNMFNICADLGYNESAGMIYNNPDAAQTRWWVGIEAIRTISYFYYRYRDNGYLDGSRSDIERLFYNAWIGYKRVFYDEIYGGVYFDPINDNYLKGWGPGGQTKVAYHLSESCYDTLYYAEFDFNIDALQ